MAEKATTSREAARNRALAAIAASQHGLFTRAQARAGGYSAAAIDYRTRRGIWSVVDYGVYRFAATPPSWHQRLLAACLAGVAVASHRSSAGLWRVPGIGFDWLEVTALRHRRRKATDVIWHESRRLDARDITVLDGIPVTSFTRMILDLGTVSDATQLLVCFDDGARRGLTSWTRVSNEVERFGHRRLGIGSVKAMLGQRSPTEPARESPKETIFETLVVEHGLPRPVSQHVIVGASGRFVAKVDYAYLPERVVIEIDGATYHAGTTQWRADLARQNRIVALDWDVLRFTGEDLERRPAEVVSQVRGLLLLKGASLTPE